MKPFFIVFLFLIVTAVVSSCGTTKVTVTDGSASVESTTSTTVTVKRSAE